MAKCKCCGAELYAPLGVTVCICEYCDTKQTIHSGGNEKKDSLFERANALRMACQFDKAATVYEDITKLYSSDPEGYWGHLLCEYGIEYVDDPATGRKVPTCHRSSFDSLFEPSDNASVSDFDMVTELSEGENRQVYRAQAKEIEEIRKRIIEVSSKEKPYDVFICYKELGLDGQRTIDSVMAQDVYDKLTEKGYRVFFSRITLEDKLGIEYEPYIFAALNSAKVMLAFGTDYEYFHAVWVKNEWSRFLKIMAKSEDKFLIPCYKDIDAYDMPKEFSRLQAQDMGKIGAMQDLIRGVEKLLGKDKLTTAEPTTSVSQEQRSSLDIKIERGMMSLEDGAFDEAKKFFNDALDIDNKHSDCYLGLFMADIKAQNLSMTKERFVAGDYLENRFYKRSKQFGSEEKKALFSSWETERSTLIEKQKELKKKEAAEREKKIQSEKASSSLEPKIAVVKKEEPVVIRKGKIVFSKCKVGDAFEFGNIKKNGKVEPLVWQVLRNTGKYVLVISHDFVDKRSLTGIFHEKVPWGKFEVRRWLNNTFYNVSFDNSEKEKIVTVNVEPHKNPEYPATSNGEKTVDRIFLLSSLEAEQYFKSDLERACRSGWWWLRTSGVSNRSACMVNSDGSINYSGGLTNECNGGIRPAMWIKF